MAELNYNPQYKININKDSQENNEEIIKLEKLLLQCNKAAMDYLKKDALQECLDLLKKSEKLLNKEYKKNQQNLTINRLLGITLNNIGCYYKRNNKPNVALHYLKKSLQIEIYSINDSATIAATHLNICAILSRLQKHEEAMQHAKLAIELLEIAKNSLFDLTQYTKVKNYLFEKIPDQNNINLSEKAERLKNIILTSIISYYNLGIEQEYLQLYDQCLETYQKGLKIAIQEIGEQHPLSQGLKDNFNEVRQKIESIEARQIFRAEAKQKASEQGYREYIHYHKKVEIDPRLLDKKFDYIQCIKKNKKEAIKKQNRSTQHQIEGYQTDSGNENSLPPIKIDQKVRSKSTFKDRLDQSYGTSNNNNSNYTNRKGPNYTTIQEINNEMNNAKSVSQTPNKLQRLLQNYPKEQVIQENQELMSRSMDSEQLQVNDTPAFQLSQNTIDKDRKGSILPQIELKGNSQKQNQRHLNQQKQEILYNLYDIDTKVNKTRMNILFLNQNSHTRKNSQNSYKFDYRQKVKLDNIKSYIQQSLNQNYGQHNQLKGGRNVQKLADANLDQQILDKQNQYLSQPNDKCADAESLSSATKKVQDLDRYLDKANIMEENSGAGQKSAPRLPDGKEKQSQQPNSPNGQSKLPQAHTKEEDQLLAANHSLNNSVPFHQSPQDEPQQTPKQIEADTNFSRENQSGEQPAPVEIQQNLQPTQEQKKPDNNLQPEVKEEISKLDTTQIGQQTYDPVMGNETDKAADPQSLPRESKELPTDY